MEQVLSTEIDFRDFIIEREGQGRSYASEPDESSRPEKRDTTRGPASEDDLTGDDEEGSKNFSSQSDEKIDDFDDVDRENDGREESVQPFRSSSSLQGMPKLILSSKSSNRSRKSDSLREQIHVPDVEHESQRSCDRGEDKYDRDIKQ